MDNKSQKERLEQELRFLRESFEAEVISKDEFEKGRYRIEKKLGEIQKSEGRSKEEAIQKIEERKITEKNEAEAKHAAAGTGAEEKIELRVIQDEEHEHFEPQPVNVQPDKVEEPVPDEPVPDTEDKKRDNKFFTYAIVFIVMVFIIFFSYSIFKGNDNAHEATLDKKQSEVIFVAVCDSNDDCKQEGKESFCLNPGTKESKCESIDIEKVNILIVNDRKNCFNCDAQRVLSILESWFGAISAKEIDYNTNDGKTVAEKFNAKLLPLYILDANITRKPQFEQYRQIFTEAENMFVLDNDASGSTYYFKRNSIQNKLDLFVVEKDNASIKAEKNLNEFLDAFKEVKFERHLSNGALAKELEIKIFPSFLINNVIKFGGVHTAETIKENFCKMNKVPACEKSLSRSLI
ncbi:MAG: hypothetical protein AABX33_00675 [Nanoarchaeota archaeon]